MRHEWAARADVALALADGRLPAGVEEDSADGHYYRRLIEVIEADLVAAPPLTDAQVAHIIPILRQGGWGHE